MTISRRITNAEMELISRQKKKNHVTCCTMAAFYDRLTEQSISALFTPRPSVVEAVAEFRRELRP
ncbi:MAG: hypothetical protein WCK54_18335 [Desulfuromonadales bacterium]